MYCLPHFCTDFYDTGGLILVFTLHKWNVLHFNCKHAVFCTLASINKHPCSSSSRTYLLEDYENKWLKRGKKLISKITQLWICFPLIKTLVNLSRAISPSGSLYFFQDWDIKIVVNRYASLTTVIFAIKFEISGWYFDKATERK